MFWKYSSLSSFPPWRLLESKIFKFWRKSNFQCILLLWSRDTLLCFIPEALEFQLTFRSFILILERRYSLFHQKYDVNYRWLIRLRKFPSILTWVSYCEWMLDFVKCSFCVCGDNHVFLFLILIWSITLIDLWMLSQPSIPGMNPLRVYNLFYILLDLIH